MTSKGTLADVADSLTRALDTVRSTESEARIGWAWMLAEYRQSSERAFHDFDGALTITDAGIPALEAAMTALLGDQQVKLKWRDEDVWTTVLSLLAAAHHNKSIDLEAALRQIRNPPPVRQVAALANVTWDEPPRTLGNVAIAHICTSAEASSLASTLDIGSEKAAALVRHLEQLLDQIGEHVLATATSARQGELAHDDFKRTVKDLLGLTVLLSPNLDANGIFSMRGSTNKPGLRGTTLDRTALGRVLTGNSSGELSAQILTITGWSAGTSLRWYSAEPLPLARLLDAELSPVIQGILETQDAIAQRLRVASRWYARAFWSDEEEDAALAASVALDSLLTGKEALPGAVSKNRFAMLERDVSARAARFERYEEVYRVRSTIAHGGDATRRLKAMGGVRSMLADVRWVANQILALREMSQPASDAAFKDLWEAMQWGTLPWSLSS